MGRKSNLDIIATIGILIGLFFFIYRYYSTVNIDSTVGGTLYSFLPGFTIIAVGIYAIAEGGDVGKLGGSVGTGIGLCYLVNEAYTNSLITTVMLAGLTISQTQIWIMIISTIMGMIIYATS